MNEVFIPVLHGVVIVLAALMIAILIESWISSKEADDKSNADCGTLSNEELNRAIARTHEMLKDLRTDASLDNEDRIGDLQSYLDALIEIEAARAGCPVLPETA